MTNTILLADDSVTIQKVIELTFMDQDYEVVSVGDGDEAIARLDEIAPDVVIADVHMPGASGYDVARRSKELYPGTPVLVLVGTFEPFEVDDVGAAGADGYLKKPFDSQELLQRVGELLAGRESGNGAAVPEPAADRGDDTGTLTGVQPPSRLESEAAGWSPLPAPPGGGEAAAGEAVSSWNAGGSNAWDRAIEAPSRGDGDAGPSDEPDEATLDETSDRRLPAAGFSAGPDEDEADGPEAAAGQDDESGGGDRASEPIGDETTWVSDWQAPAAGSGKAGDGPRAGGAGGGDPFPDLASSPFAGAPAAAAAAPSPPAAAPGTASLSDEDVDRVARRVVELLADEAVREVAWEVVPDLAEVVIKDRLRELESQLD